MFFNRINHRTILRKTLKEYKGAYESSSSDYIVVDPKIMSRKLKMNERMYHHLLLYHYNKKFGLKNNKGETIDIFMPDDSNKELIKANYSLLFSACADLELEYDKFAKPIIVSLLPTFITILALLGLVIKG